MQYLALDIGKRRTGVAYAESSVGIAFPLETISHTSLEELAGRVEKLIHERTVEHVVVGLPKLPGGEEGEQVEFVKSFIPFLQKMGVEHSFIDERYTTGKSPDSDPDAAAACAILAIKLDLE